MADIKKARNIHGGLSRLLGNQLATKDEM